MKAEILDLTISLRLKRIYRTVKVKASKSRKAHKRKLLVDKVKVPEVQMMVKLFTEDIYRYNIADNVCVYDSNGGHITGVVVCRDNSTPLGIVVRSVVPVIDFKFKKIAGWDIIGRLYSEGTSIPKGDYKLAKHKSALKR